MREEKEMWKEKKKGEKRKWKLMEGNNREGGGKEKK